MSFYILWRRHCPDPLALITHDRQVKRCYGSKANEARQMHAVEFLLDHPSELALATCYVTAGATVPELFSMAKITALDVFLDLRKPKKGEVDVRLLNRPVKKARLRLPRLPKSASKAHDWRGVPGSV